MKTVYRFCKDFLRTYRIERKHGSTIRQSIFWGLVFANMAQPNKPEVI